ncbi:hypothetical protein H6758_03925 [Candidatus Nomurabacteria bacterium]|nr:hypothetical protein [Candidatus Nomurabacteria bacterium]
MCRKIFAAIFSLILLLGPINVFATPISGADADLSSYWTYDILDWVDDTTDANSATAADVSWPSGGGWEIYFGGAAKFDKIYMYISAETHDSSWSISSTDFEYWDGSSWSSLSVTNDSGAFNATGIVTLSFTAPGDWATTQVNTDASAHYYVRVVMCDMGCNTMTGSHDIDQISLKTASSGVPEFQDIVYVMVMAILVGYMLVFLKQNRDSGMDGTAFGSSG